MQYISTAHNWFRWIVMAAGLAAAARQAYNLIARQPYRETDRLLLTAFTRTLEIQAGLGSILIIREIFFRETNMGILIHGLAGLVPLGLVYLLGSLELKWSRKKKAPGVLLGVLAILVLILGISYFLPEQPAAQAILILNGHSEAVREVEYSPDQTTLATASFDGTIRLWDLSNGEEILIITASDEAVRDLSFSEDGGYLSTGSFDHRIRIWKLPEGDLVRDIPAHQASINKVIWAGDRLYSASLDNTIRVWNPETGELVRQIDHNHSGGILSLAVSANNQTIASGSIDGTIRLHNNPDDASVYLGEHAGWVYDIDFSHNGELLASGSLDETVIVWELATQSVLFQSQELGGAMQTVAFSPDGSILLAGSADSKIYVWDTATFQLINTLTGHQRGILDLEFSADGSSFASASADGTARLWEILLP